MAFKKVTQYNIPAAATGFSATNVLASVAPTAAAGSVIPVSLGFARHMKIYEPYIVGGSPAPQGLQCQLWLRETQSWGPTFIVPPNGTEFDVADLVAEGVGQGAVLGMTAQTKFFPDARGTTSRAADFVINIISSANATLIQVEETQ